jgi:hypothetical protein
MSSGRESKLDLVGPVRDSQAFSLTLPRPHALPEPVNKNETLSSRI